MEKFYILWYTGCEAKITYASQAEAEQAAITMAKTWPGYTYYVMESNIGFSATPVLDAPIKFKEPK